MIVRNSAQPLPVLFSTTVDSWHAKGLTSSKPRLHKAEYISDIYLRVTSPPFKFCCTWPHISWVQEPWKPVLIWWFTGHTFSSHDSSIQMSRDRCLWESSSFWERLHGRVVKFQHLLAGPCTGFFPSVYLQPWWCRTGRIHCQDFLPSLMALFVKSCLRPVGCWTHRGFQLVCKMGPVPWQIAGEVRWL